MARVQDTRKARNFGKSLLTREERTSGRGGGRGTPWFDGKVWSARRAAIAARVARKQGIAHERAVMHREKQSV